uniref:Uncharacterized protein n=1 Tax=Arion vulgaris TaxID=1028688 RepID=A0A0B6YPQ0_9EUPU
MRQTELSNNTMTVSYTVNSLTVYTSWHEQMQVKRSKCRQQSQTQEFAVL